ncbi:hypothetical protein [Mucilaginibacter sp.]|uniref:hypothetical protein n=1 Tax=Mucilaginibacter sp. TaxID=1882438 RepID=UPI0035BBF66B
MQSNILDIAPSLAEYFTDVEPRGDFNSVNLSESTDTISQYRPYFGLLHDSRILESIISPDQFFLQLNDFTTHVFADALVNRKRLAINDDKLVFRIDLNFKIVNLSFNTVDEEGFIKQIKPLNIDEYLYEDVISIIDGITKVGLVVWSKGKGNNSGRYILLLINAKSISVSEHQENDWQAVFSNSYDLYYNRFKTELKKGTYLSDQSLCEKLIDEIDENIG